MLHVWGSVTRLLTLEQYRGTGGGTDGMDVCETLQPSIYDGPSALLLPTEA